MEPFLDGGLFELLTSEFNKTKSITRTVMVMNLLRFYF